MRICLISDSHEYLPQISPCGLILMAGDYTLRYKRDYIGQVSALNKLGRLINKNRIPVISVFGNHETVAEDHPGLVPKLNWTVLDRETTIWNGINIWGCPHTLTFGNWGFNVSRYNIYDKCWQFIPNDTDILLVHQPPYGYGDLSELGEHLGCNKLTEAIQRVKPKLVVCGHIHNGRGIYHLDNTLIINAAIMDESYFPAYNPIYIEYTKDKIEILSND